MRWNKKRREYERRENLYQDDGEITCVSARFADEIKSIDSKEEDILK